MNRSSAFAPSLRRFADVQSMFATLADEVASDLDEAIGRRKAASLVLPGGTTPGDFFDVLNTRELPWDRVQVVPTDERWVPPDDDRSNEKLMRTRLFRNRAAGARFVALKDAHDHPAQAEDAIGAAVAAMPRPFDVTLLGMGADGHTASLFPGAAELAAALDPSSPRLVSAITPPDAPRLGLRMSLTLAAILASRRILILIRGREKMEALDLARAGEETPIMPVRAVLRGAASPVEVFWSP